MEDEESLREIAKKLNHRGWLPDRHETAEDFDFHRWLHAVLVAADEENKGWPDTTIRLGMAEVA
jgi:hypothetical protein